MAKCKLLMSTAQVQKLIDFFDGYEDDKVKCKFIKKTGIKAEIECETELSPDEAASYCKGLFKKTPEGGILYFSTILAACVPLPAPGGPSNIVLSILPSPLTSGIPDNFSSASDFRAVSPYPALRRLRSAVRCRRNAGSAALLR